MADIGSDHALLPSYLAEQGTIVKGVAGEVNAGPFEAASKQVRFAGLAHVIDVRLGDGLAVIERSEVDVITIAGMGGVLIASILEAGKAKLEGVKRLVLQPNVGEDAVREWLLANGWSLLNERILEEDGKIYEILTAELGSSEEADQLYKPLQLNENVVVSREMLITMGPHLVQQCPEVWVRKWRLELDKLEKVCSQLKLSQMETAREKEARIREQINRIEEVLSACSPKVKPSFN